MAALQLEVLRWQIDVVAFQECASARPLDLLERSNILLGATPVNDAVRTAGFVQLQVRKGVSAELVSVPEGVPAVCARLTTSAGCCFDVAAVHLMPSEVNKKERQD